MLMVTDIDADFAVRNGTDKFFVDNVTGNTNIEGTLTADGHTELNSTLNVDSNLQHLVDNQLSQEQLNLMAQLMLMQALQSDQVRLIR